MALLIIIELMPKGGKYYAVRVGRKPGIYRTWDEARAQVSGFKNAAFKSFASEQDAADFIEQRASVDEPGVVIYTDGSHIKGTTVRGIGAHCLHEGREYVLSRPCDDLPADASNPTLELMAATAALRSVPSGHAPLQITIVADYIGVTQYLEGVWRPRDSQKGAFGAAARELVSVAAALRERGFDVRARHVDGHAGVPGNEAADRLAKARTARSTLEQVWRAAPISPPELHRG